MSDTDNWEAKYDELQKAFLKMSVYAGELEERNENQKNVMIKQHHRIVWLTDMLYRAKTMIEPDHVWGRREWLADFDKDGK